MSELRFDPLTHRPVIIAESRSARPNEHAGGRGAGMDPADCPFCEGHEDRTPPEVAALRSGSRSANGPGWTVRVIPNKFPSLSAGPHEASAVATPGFRAEPGFGYHEVVIESPRHAPLFPDLEAEQCRAAIRVARDRVRALADRDRIRHVLLFENAGPESGGTLWHPHAQLVASAVDGPRTAEELFALREHRSGCAIEAILDAERAAGTRVLGEHGGLTAIAPFASEYPFEVRLVPRRHVGSFGEASDAEADAVADLLSTILRGLSAEVPGASYNWFVASLSPAHPSRGAYHWQISVVPRLVRPDGFELGTGIAVNPVAPESAAARLRARWDLPR